MVGEGGRSCGHRSQCARGIAKCRLGNGGSVVLVVPKVVPKWRKHALSLLTAKDVWM